MKELRVFPSRTVATPEDELAVVGLPGLFTETYDKISISVSFSWDLQKAEMLERQWKPYGPVTIGGPALGDKAVAFTPGRFLKKGWTITSRGCPNKCWFCSVPKRYNGVTELPIHDGWILQDDNLLACSDAHIKAVFSMLKRQPEPISFRGGIEAKLLKRWHVDEMEQLRLESLFVAYDTPDDLDPLLEAGKLLDGTKINKRNRKARCYVLIGYPADTMEKAEVRLRQTWNAGFLPFAMLWRNKEGVVIPSWVSFQRKWCRPAITISMLNQIL